MKFFQKKYFFVGLFLFFIILLFYNTEKMGQLMYPIKFQQDIQSSAESFDISPFLIASIIRTESNYNTNTESKQSAVGLMQIMPDTADWIISRAGYSAQMKERMKEADVNIQMGTWYLDWLTNRFEEKLHDNPSIEDQIAIVAAAYNAGHNKINEWFDNDIWDGQYNSIQEIPYGETRHYIKRVIYYYKKYDAFYSNDWFPEDRKEALN